VVVVLSKKEVYEQVILRKFREYYVIQGVNRVNGLKSYLFLGLCNFINPV